MNKILACAVRQKRIYFGVFIAVLLAGPLLCSADEWQPMIKDTDSLTRLLEEMKQEYDQPAMAAAIVRGDSIIVEAAVGYIAYGDSHAVDTKSRFHIGSTTKSMTALLVAMLVKQGKLDYGMTLEQSLPGLPMREEYRAVTIADVLNNRAGIIAFQLTTLEDPAVVKQLMEEIPALYADPLVQRREVAKLVLNLEPIAEPGTKTIYSNVGWAIVGHILELAAEQPYEELLQERIFDPLAMQTARVGGWPASSTEPLQPRGHYFDPATPGPPVPQALDDEYVLSAWMNPSGGVHCSTHDFALYVQEHLLGLTGKGRLLEQDSYKTMHSVQVTTNIKEMYPYRNEDREVSFGYGWAVLEKDYGLVSVAAGSGGTFFAQIFVDPYLNFAFVGFTNCGNGGKALNDLYRKIAGQE